jgi:serine/threonine protein kinase
MSFQLVVLAGPDRGRAFTLQSGPSLMLGRGAACLYHLTDPRVSRAHCEVVLEADQVTLIDNGGSGGVFVNDAQTQRQVLKLGDVIRLGDTQLRLTMGDFPLDVVLAAVEPVAAAPPPAAVVERLESLSGTKLGHYDIGPVIGRGSSSVVFQADDLQHQRSLAFKVLLPDFARNEEEKQRFIRGMKTALPLRHPNLITVYAAGKTGPYCWVAMEYIAGENMAQVIERIGVAGMLDWRYAFKVAVHVGRALAYAHGQHIIHRNVTPTNIMLQATDKVVKLGDLVLAKALAGANSQPLTRPGELVGAVEYMSPERTRGDAPVDGRSDVYSLGATVYALLAGRPPFEGATLIEKITRIRQTEPVKPSKYQRGIPPDFEWAVLKMLAKAPAQRYVSVEQLVTELERVGKMCGVSV